MYSTAAVGVQCVGRFLVGLSKANGQAADVASDDEVEEPGL